MLKKRPKVSVIIPVCNDERYLIQCIESVVQQTMLNLEIICVEDASSDGSYELLQRLVRKHPERDFKIIHHEYRMSACQCRKDGVLASEGEYIIFVDSDDYIEPNTCQIAYDAIVKARTDVLQYGTVVENCGNIPEERITLNQKALIPYTKDVVTGNLQKVCFIENKFNASIWNKICRGDVCRRAFEQIEDGIIHYAEDLYAFFMVSFFAKSYAAIDNKLYHYCFGRGLVGTNEISLEKFKIYCQGANVIRAMRRFLMELDEEERFECGAVVDRIEKNLIGENCSKWFTYLEPKNKQKGLDYICEAWKISFDELISILVCSFYYKRGEIADALRGYHALQYRPRKIKNIVLYYRNIFNGGAQRVVAELCNLFVSKIEESNIILVTDEYPVDGEYDLLPQVKRVVVPSVTASREWHYKEKRLKAWIDIIDEYRPDVVINSMWLDPVTFWDMLIIKSHSSHPAYVFHCHSFFATMYEWKWFNVSRFRKEYSLADSIITLSNCDKRFWGSVNPHTYMIPNPCQFKAGEERSIFENKEILWVGRISPEKQPLEIPRIMEKVLTIVPDAICRIVGEGEKCLMDNLKNEIQVRGLQAHIILEGFHKDLQPFYKKASVLITTSSFEGFHLTLFEAAAFGLPTVTYDLPWLEYYNLINGWTTVPQLDTGAAAASLAELLQDEALWQEKSNAIYSSFVSYKDTAILPAWQQVFKNLETRDCQAKLDDPELTLIIDQINAFHQKALSGTSGGDRPRKRFDFHFPWKMVVPGSKLIIYGGGDMGKQYRDLLEMTNYCEIVAFCDRNPSGTGITNKKVLSIEELAAMSSDKYDAIIIAIADGKIAKSVRESLEQSGINWGKIIWQVMRT